MLCSNNNETKRGYQFENGRHIGKVEGRVPGRGWREVREGRNDSFILIKMYKNLKSLTFCVIKCSRLIICFSCSGISISPKTPSSFFKENSI